MTFTATLKPAIGTAPVWGVVQEIRGVADMDCQQPYKLSLKVAESLHDRETITS
jgi:hypothetical protein